MFNGSAVSLTMLEGGIAELNFDLQGESVNKFNALTVKEFGEAVTLLDDAEDVNGLLVTSSKPVFIVGADISEFVPLFASGDLDKVQEVLAINNEFMNTLEDLDFPSCAAITGVRFSRYEFGGQSWLA